ncbi:MAG: hypothetical protein ACPH92_02985, partial [Candidatus Puniceispirillaceae bacterium]
MVTVLSSRRLLPSLCAVILRGSGWIGSSPDKVIKKLKKGGPLDRPTQNLLRFTFSDSNVPDDHTERNFVQHVSQV